MTTESSEQEAFSRALAALQSGQFADAVRLFDAVLGAQPKHIAALNLLGITHTRLGRFADAESYLKRALNEQPNSEATLYNYGLVLKALHRPSEALARFTEALALNPGAAETWNSRGTAFNDLKRHREAIDDFDKAIALQPAFAEAFCNKGNTLLMLGLLNEALAAFERAAALKPNLDKAWRGTAQICYALEQHEKALAAYDRVLGLKPDLWDAWCGRGNTLSKLKRPDEALVAYDRALAIKPDDGVTHSNRAAVLLTLRRHEEALTSCNRAIALDPKTISALGNHSAALLGLKRYEEAIKSCDEALLLDPSFAEAHINRSAALLGLGRYSEALLSADRAVLLNPTSAWAHCNRGAALLGLNQHLEALESSSRAVLLDPNSASAHSNRGATLLILAEYEQALAACEAAFKIDPDLQYVEGNRLQAKQLLCDWSNFEAETTHFLDGLRNRQLIADPFFVLSTPSSLADQLQCAKRYLQIRQAFSPIWRGEKYLHRRIRVAYLSADFHEHATAYLAAGLFEHHDRSRFEITAISFGNDDKSAMRRRLENAFEHFHHVEDRTSREIAELIRREEIDVAVDLKGFTGNSRYEILARRPAPIQAAYLGYPGTTGAPFIDYIIADATTVPEEHFDFYTEKIVWLPDSYQVNDHKRPIDEDMPTRRECGLPDYAIVFCCFNNTFKITPSIFDVWMRLLEKTEGSVLWLFEGNSSNAASICRENLCQEAEKRGVARPRLIFAPKTLPAKHLARHRLADIFVDTLPYNAHTTASDALWAGLPIVTCLGSTFAGRVAASLLRAVGLPELITSSLAEYEALALKLSLDPTYLARIKVKLARARNECPLFNTERFTRHIEAAYLGMWQAFQSGQSPENFRVTSVPASQHGTLSGGGQRVLETGTGRSNFDGGLYGN